MSKISISVENPTNNLDAVKLIHKVTGIPLTQAKERISEGRTGVFYSAELFLNDHPSRDGEIRALLEGFRRLGIPLFIAEISYDQDWCDVVDLDAARMEDDVLKNILDRTKDRYS